MNTTKELRAAQTIVVIGAGQAGGWTARALRDEGFAGRLVLIGDEAHPPHERPPLSKAVLAGKAAPEMTHLFPPGTFEELCIEWRRQERVRALDRGAQRVVLSAGEPLRYDRAIICTGGRARTLPVPGTDLPGVFTLRSIEDSMALADAFRSAKGLVVVGGGWIGLEVAATARGKGLDVTIVEATPMLCARTAPREISDYLRSLHEGNGVRILLGSGLASITRNAAGVLSVRLADGQALETDVVVIGVGLVPNDELAREAGIACDGGILVDEFCRTSDPTIFAAGDVAVSRTRWCGRPVRLESWQNAQDQAIAAAKAALGRDVRYDPLPWFWSDQYNVNLQIYGLPTASHRPVLRGYVSSRSFLAFYLEEDRVRAAVGVNAGRELRFARRLIEQSTRVRDADLADPAVALAGL